MEDESEIWQVVSSRYFSKGAKTSTEKKVEYGGSKARDSSKFAIAKRGKRLDRDSYREDVRRMPKTQRTDEADAEKRPFTERRKEPSHDRVPHIGNDVSSLIGRPVVLADRRPSDGRPFDSQHQRREERRPGNRGQRGGLLFVNHRDVFGDSGAQSERRQTEESVQFDVLKESWPGMEGSLLSEVATDSQNPESTLNWCGWSDVVKSAPKPRPLAKPKAVVNEVRKREKVKSTKPPETMSTRVSLETPC